MQDSYECHVISLAREPEKRAAFLDRNRDTGLTFQIFDAVDGTRLTQTECVSTGLLKEGAVRYTQGALGCAASHRALWQQADATGRNYLIFEDDVYCRRDFAAQLGNFLPELHDWDIVLLGYNTDAVFDVRIFEHADFAGFFSNPRSTQERLRIFAETQNPVTAVRLNNAFGLCAYLISPQGARKLAAAFPMDNREVFIPGNKPKYGLDRFYCMSLDMLTNVFYRGINAYAAIPPLAMPLNDPTTSTTDRRPG